MARKGEIIANIRKENPILTIINAGKIPVVRLGNTGFQNFKQDKYFSNYCSGAYSDKKSKENKRGCFVSLLGVQGNYVCGGHYGEAIHIGYLEPDDIVFSTHFFDSRNKGYYNQTAKERFESAKKDYETFQRGVEKKNWDPDDFDLYSEAIVDNKKIKKVTVIGPNEYQHMLPYCNDGMFKIFNAETIFYNIVWNGALDEEFVSHMHWTLSDCHHYFFKETEIYELIECPYYKETILEELINYYSTGNFKRGDDFYLKMQDALLEYADKMKIYYPNTAFKDNRMLFYVYKNDIGFYYEKQEWREDFKISASSNKETVALSIAKGGYYDKNYETIEFTEENILSKEYRHLLYNLVEMKQVFDDILGEFIKIKYPKWMQKLENFRNFEKELAEWRAIKYLYDEKNHEIYFITNEFYYLYNMILDDGNIEISVEDGREYYNIENLPDGFNKFWLDIINDILSKYKKLFN